MFELQGRYAKAKVFTDCVEKNAVSQVINLLNQPYAKNSRVRMMPDIHAGKGCTIGTTMTITDKICPNLVGVDISCGMETAHIAETDFNPEKLDQLIRSEIPSGFSIRATEHSLANEIDLTELYCHDRIDLARAYKSIGTLGGGNHFIEVDVDDTGGLFIVIHSGSRNLAVHYQNLAVANISAQKKIEHIPEDLAYVEGEALSQYLHDVEIACLFAELNRKAMMNTIIEGMGFHIVEQFTTVHNYIDVQNKILRKGSVSARIGEKLLIPINMRDGSLICTGKGNEDWNFSAPHGAGRLLSRSEAKDILTVEEFEREMQGIYSTSVKRSTLDESPMVYKSMDDIIRNIEPTVEIDKIIRPVYNFKAG